MFTKVKPQPGSKRATISITESRRMKLERAAIEITVATGKTAKWTDVVNWMIDNYTDDAKKDITSKNKGV